MANPNAGMGSIANALASQQAKAGQTGMASAPVAPQGGGMPDSSVIDKIASTNETDPMQTVQEVNELALYVKMAIAGMVEAMTLQQAQIKNIEDFLAQASQPQGGAETMPPQGAQGQNTPIPQA